METIVTAINNYVRGIRINRLFNAQSGALADYHDATNRFTQGMVTWCALLQQGTQANAWQVPAPNMMALMMFHAMHGLVDDALARGEIDRRSSLVSILTETFNKALRQ